MPLYEYGCPSCGLVTDIRHGFDEKPEAKCERCGTALVRRFSAAPIVFKGSGFYVTDSRKSGSKESTKSESSEKSDKTASSEKPEGAAKTDAASKSDGGDSGKSGPNKEAAA